MKNWTFDNQHSSVGFVVRHMMFAKVRGTFSDWDAAMAWDPEHPEDTTVTATIRTASVSTGVDDRDAHLRSDDFFACEEYPEMTFESTSVTADGGDIEMTGDLTIRDVTQPVTLDVSYNGSGTDPWGNERAGFTATGTINRKDFGLKWNQALESGGVLVGDTVTIDIEVEALEADD